MFGDGDLYVLEVNPQTFRFHNKLLDFVLEEIAFFGFGRGGNPGHNRSGTYADFKQPGVNQRSKYLVRCVRIDFEFATQGPHRREVIPGPQSAGDDGSCGGVDNLFVKGSAGDELDVKRNHGACTMT